MVNIDKASDKVDQASGFFDKMNKFIRRHPVWFIVIILLGFFYWVSTLPESEEIPQETVHPDIHRHTHTHEGSHGEAFVDEKADSL